MLCAALLGLGFLANAEVILDCGSSRSPIGHIPLQSGR